MDPKIDTKITLYDADDKRIGETFTRRARQLVKQQRAVWTDEHHVAIRFLPDAVEDWEPEAVWKTDETRGKPTEENEDAMLYNLARNRISTRRRMFWNTFLLLPGYFVIMLIGNVGFRLQWYQGFATGVGYTLWTLVFIYTLYNFIKFNRGYYQITEVTGRQARKIAREIEHLRRMGFKA